MSRPGPRATGERIEALLDASAASGPLARERAEELVRLLLDLYGAGLDRILTILHDAGRLDAGLLDRLADDELVASLLLVHGLHPYDLHARVERALDAVRATLGSHGAGVELAGIGEDRVVRLRVPAAAGCGSSAATIAQAVEAAVLDAAPEVTAIEVDEAAADVRAAAVIPVSALRSRLDRASPVAVGGVSAGSGQAADPLAVLTRVAAGRPVARPGERCEMCAAPIAEPHPHVVDLSTRALVCACRACALLFTADHAQLRYRTVPDRYLRFGDFALSEALWDELEIPVGLAFFFHNSSLGRTIAFYPGPAGATESDLPLGAWERVLADNPTLAGLAPDVEALIVRAPDRTHSGFACYLVPVDRCYELVGGLRLAWRGFDGGHEARALLDRFFDELQARARVAR